MRRLGDITLDLEVLITEMIDDHDLQWGEILGLVFTNLQIHRPDAQEEYDAGGSPIFYYGPTRE